MDKNLPANAGDTGLISGKISHASEQLSAVPQLPSPSSRACELELLSLCAATTELDAP